jgi:uncharacterized protein YodC (DUF2158 family)
MFSKCLKHNPNTGFAKKDDIDKNINAWHYADKQHIDKIALYDDANRKLENLIGGKSSNTLGYNPNRFSLHIYYTVDSLEGAFEMLEVYGKSLSRDITFYDLERATHKSTKTIISSLNAYDSITAPTANGIITGKTLFRGGWHGETSGPYISQFLYLPYSYGNMLIDQKYYSENDIPAASTFKGWLNIQNGVTSGIPTKNDNITYIHNPRVLGSIVHNDPLYQFYYNACLVAMQNGINPSGFYSDKITSWTSSGGPDILATVSHVALGALRCGWYQKWGMGMKIRPEVYAQRIELALTSDKDFVADVPGLADIKKYSEIGQKILDLVKNKNKELNGEETVLLPSLYTEGSPTHPSWPAGHACVAGACSTVMKAMLQTHDDKYNRLPWPKPVKHSIDGITLVDYEGHTKGMTIVGEFNKLASNVSLGRDFGGVHYRCDGGCGNVLGEKYAITYLIDKCKEYIESKNKLFKGFILEKFDGSIIKINKYGTSVIKK